MMFYDEFIDVVNSSYKDNFHDTRYGEIIMNVLHGIWPQKYYEVLGTEFDCSYNDQLVSKLIEKLRSEWYKTS